jgi:predicted phage baseplate assembly protein
MSCEHDCQRPPLFPRPIENRPGLDQIARRIGTYAEMRAHMLAAIDAAPALARFTHRKPDDPAIALLEGAAIVGDILTFYQQLYGNEAYLRTAQWRDSVADLVKLLGYRLAPGLGGQARFALAAKGDRPVAVPAGFAIQAQLEGAPKPATFETSEAVTAWPGLSQFHLYRPRYTPAIGNGTDSFALVAPLPAGLALKAGDRVLVGVPRADGTTLDHGQLMTVERSWSSFGTTLVKMKGALTSLDATLFVLAAFGFGFGVAARRPVTHVPELRAYKLGASFRHFGQGAPATQVTVDANGRAHASDVSYIRNLAGGTGAPASPPIAAADLPLDGSADGPGAGTLVVVEGALRAGAGGSGRKRFLERRVEATDRRSLAWGPSTGPSTVLSLDRNLSLRESTITLDHADIRTLTVHQVEGAAFRLQALPQPVPDASGTALDFYGSAADAAALDQRTILLAGPGAALSEARVVDVAAGGATPGFHRVTLDRALPYAEFDHNQPAVTVYGNLATATEGKSQPEAVLGDGDGRAVFQTFALPKPPLTYLLDPGQAPPHAPELEVYVGGRLWRRVDVLFGSGPGDPVYVVREDEAGKSYVQFGDGKSGARLPSGRGNVTARWRSGSGSHGPLKADAKPQPASRLPGLDQLLMPEPVTGGAAPESADGARAAAPGRMQSLGRLVSLADIEAEALALAGVLKARALWSLADGVPHVVVTILTLSASAADEAAAADALLAIYRARGPARYPVTVRQGRRLQLQVAARVGWDPSRREADVRAAILDALGAAASDATRDHGLFSWQQRQLGEAAHGSQIVAAIQNAAGVAWVELLAAAPRDTGLHLLPILHGPILHRPILHGPILRSPGPPPSRRVVACPEDAILALDAADLSLALAAADPSEVP